jgi:APA family basic amino acid/polyamine antiporter
MTRANWAGFDRMDQVIVWPPSPDVRLVPIPFDWRTPYRAELAAATLVIALILFVDVRGAIGFSSFAVLVYYGIANVSAWTQPSKQRRWPRTLEAFGVAGCAVLARTLPLSSILGGLTVVVLGALVWVVRN